MENPNTCTCDGPMGTYLCDNCADELFEYHAENMQDPSFYQMTSEMQKDHDEAIARHNIQPSED